MGKYPKLSIRLPGAMLEQLRAIARREGHTVGWIVREAIEQYLFAQQL